MSLALDTSLIPDPALPWERAVSSTIGSRLAALFVQVALLRTLWDPMRCPPEQLPLLAWAFSVDIWNDAWPLTRKRQVVAEARDFHTKKTTVAGYRMALGYVDAELVRANLPRDGFYVGRSPTPAEHDAWLASLPEIRIYRAAPRTRPGRKGFFLGRTPIAAATDVVRDMRRAELRRGGTVTPLVFSGILRDSTGRLLTDTEHLVIPAPARRMLKPGAFLRSPIGSAKLVGLRILTPQFGDNADPFLPNVISPGLTPAEVTPRMVAEPRPAGRGLFVNRPRLRRGVRPNDAERSFYLSIRLADGSSPKLSRMRNVINKTRLRREAYTVGLLVHAPRPPAPRFVAFNRVIRAAPKALIAALEHAIAVSQPARDILYLDINSTRPLAYRDLAQIKGPVRYGVAVRT